MDVKSGLTVDSPNFAMSGKSSLGALESIGSACPCRPDALTMTSRSSCPVVRPFPLRWRSASIPDVVIVVIPDTVLLLEPMDGPFFHELKCNLEVHGIMKWKCFR